MTADARRKLTADRIEEAYRLKREEGKGPTEVAMILGVNKSTITRLFQKDKPADADNDAAAAGLRDIPFNQIRPSPLNPRKTFDDQSIAELAASIAAKGVLQNLIVRPDPRQENAFEIVAGERRWRAVALNVQAGVTAGVTLLPCRVVDCDDFNLLQTALTENVARDDMTPLEEAEGFQALIGQSLTRDCGGDKLTPPKIAALIGRSARHVQLRLDLLTKLVAAGQEALRCGDITLAQARALTMGGPEHQATIINDIIGGRWNPPPRSIKQQFSNNLIATDIAIFPLNAYQGEFIEDPDDPDIRYFADCAQYRRLQSQAIDDLKSRLEQTWDWVKVLAPNEDYHDWKFDRLGKPGHGAGVIISVSHDDLQVTTHEGLVPKPSRADGGGPAASPPAELCAKNHLIHAHNRKTAALQNVIAGNFSTALRLCILALMGDSTNCRIRPDSHHPDDLVRGDVVDAILDRFRVDFKGLLEAAGRSDPLRLSGKPSVAAAAYKILIKMPDDAVKKLFAALVAARSGTFNDHVPTFGDSPLAITLAERLGITGHEVKHGLFMKAGDLNGLKKPALERIAADHDVIPGPTIKAAKAAIEDKAFGVAVVPTLLFHSAAAIEDLLTPLNNEAAAEDI